MLPRVSLPPQRLVILALVFLTGLSHFEFGKPDAVPNVQSVNQAEPTPHRAFLVPPPNSSENWGSVWDDPEVVPEMFPRHKMSPAEQDVWLEAEDRAAEAAFDEDVVTYTVQPGDYLALLADAFDTTVDHLVYLNPQLAYYAEKRCAKFSQQYRDRDISKGFYCNSHMDMPAQRYDQRGENSIQAGDTLLVPIFD